MSDRDFEQVAERTVFDGVVMRVTVDDYRFADGEVVEREIVHRPGAVAIVAHDGECVYLTRQPRPAIGDPDSLELPAGLLDKDGEPPQETARRELAEEIGKAPQSLEHLLTYFSSVGSTDEQVHLYLATDLRDREEDSGENERIEIVRWPLTDLDGALAATSDAKTIIGLLLLRGR
jgi:8-oxo-dGTP pyrophosphatase MutT (NUDIX family)